MIIGSNEEFIGIKRQSIISDEDFFFIEKQYNFLDIIFLGLDVNKDLRSNSPPNIESA